MTKDMDVVVRIKLKNTNLLDDKALAIKIKKALSWPVSDVAEVRITEVIDVGNRL